MVGINALGVGKVGLDLQVTTGFNWPLYLSTVSCKQLLSCPTYPSGFPKFILKISEQNLQVLEVDPDIDMKANIEIFIRTMLEVAIGEKVPQTVGVN